MNSVTLIGNVATEIDVRHPNAELTVASFLVAVDRGVKSDDPNAQTADFVKVTTWNGTAKACAEYLGKGKRVGITGQLRSSRYEKNGEQRYSLEVRANRVEFLSPREGNAPATSSPATPEPSDDDIPF